MKKRMFAVMMAAVMMIGTAAAQPQRPEGEKREKPTAEQMAKFRTERMAKELDLNKEQQQQIYDMTLTRINAAQKKSQSDRAAMAAERKSADEKMQKILTPDQYKKWGEMQKKQADMGRAKGQRGGWHGKGPKGPDAQKAHAPGHHGKGKKHDGKCCKDGKGKCCKNGKAAAKAEKK